MRAAADRPGILFHCVVGRFAARKDSLGRIQVVPFPLDGTCRACARASGRVTAALLRGSGHGPGL